MPKRPKPSEKYFRLQNMCACVTAMSITFSAENISDAIFL